jgi:hypothetical protein
VDSGLKFIRRKRDNETIYFVVNHTSKAIYQWIPLGVQTEKVLIFDPLSSKQGLAQSKIIDGIRHTRVELKSGSSLVLRAVSKSEANPWDYYKTQSSSIDLNGSWNLSFLKGGPQLPKSIRLDSLVSWTELGTVYENFSGTAVYEHQFTLGETSADAWLLQIKDLRESAKIWLDGNYIGSIWANPFEIQLPNMKQGQHSLKIQVSNLGANRIRAKELRGEEWKNFYEINMVNKDYQAFDATLWEPTPSGIINTPKIIPLKISN